MVIIQCISVLLLGGCAVTDWLWKRIWLPAIGIGAVAMAACQWGRGQSALQYVVTGILLGGFFIGMHYVLGGGIGMGDGFLIGAAAMGMELWQNGLFLFFGFLYAFLVAGIRLLLGRLHKKDSIAFAPFLFISYLTVLTFEI